VSVIPRDLVAKSLGVAPEALPPGDLPVDRLAARWLGFMRAADEAVAPQEQPDYWTVALLDDLARGQPDLCLDTVLAALALCETADELALLAAGPLEDVIAQSGATVIDRIEAEAAGSARLRLALDGVMPPGSSGTALWQRVVAARGDAPVPDPDAPLPG
jgi:hypothetical protein